VRAPPSPVTADATRSRVASEAILSKATSTMKAYGDFTTLKKGAIGEFADWCAADSNETVRGDKVPRLCLGQDAESGPRRTRFLASRDCVLL
jgi:hypothetical protein